MKGTFVTVPLDTLTDPPPGPVWNCKNHWWAHVPGESVVFYKIASEVFAQANTDKAIVEGLIAKMTGLDGAEALFVRNAFVPDRGEAGLRLPKVST